MALRVNRKDAARYLQLNLDGEAEETARKPFRDNEEAREQALLFARRKEMLGKYRSLRWMFATLNGIPLTPAMLKKTIEQGVVKGVLDVWLPLLRRDPGASYCGVVIDLKSEKGRPSSEQLEWAAHLVENRWRVYFCNSGVEAWRVIASYLGITGEDHYAEDMERQSEHMKGLAAARKGK